jgi:hypothetical protein
MPLSMKRRRFAHLVLAAAWMPAQSRSAAAISRVQGHIGDWKVNSTGTLDFALALQRAYDPLNPLPPKVTGPSHEGGAATVDGSVFGLGYRSLMWHLGIPAALWQSLKPGAYPLGEVPGISGNRGQGDSSQGWSGACADLNTHQAYFAFQEFGPVA